VPNRFADTWSRLESTLTRPEGPAAGVLERTSRAARLVRRVVTPIGWAVFATLIGAWIVGWQLGWREAMLLAAAALSLLVIAAVFLIGRANLHVNVMLQPRRVSVGTPAAGQVNVTNISPRRMWPIRLELRVGAAIARFNLPSLPSNHQHDELFVIPTSRRAVVAVGPALTVRGDPLGLMRREVAWTGVTELFVHPRIVGLDPLGSGLLRDLEGQNSNAVSMSDLAFHALRDYAAGDDRRYIHWRSSARTGQLMVRQFVDTRRIHATMVVDGDPASYGHEDEFELALSAAGSVAVRAIQDEQQASILAADEAVADGNVQQILDGLTRAEFHDESDLAVLTGKILRNAPDTSIAILITGSVLPFGTMRRAAAALPPEIDTVALRVDPKADPGMTSVGNITVLTLHALNDLPALMRVVAER
jgi:uncharacterized protein (DUF58 family)